MPVDLGIPNLIIQAFQAGREEKMKREELALRKEQEIEIRKQREAELKERQHQFDEQEKRREAEHKAKLKLDEAANAFKALELGAKQQESYVKTGLLPPGAKRTVSGNIDIVEHPETGISFQTPQDAIEQMAEREATLLNPKVEARIRELQAKEEAVGFRQQQIESDKAAFRQEMQTERLKSLADISEKRNENMFNIAKLRTQATIQAATIRAAKAGIKLKPLSDKQIDALTGLDVLEHEFTELKSMITARPDFLQAPISGGISNVVNTLTRGEPKEFQDIRAKQASVVSVIGHALYGSALTSTEVGRLTAEMGALGRGESLESGIAKINNAIGLLQLKRQERLKYLEAGGRDVSGVKSTGAKFKGKWITKPDGTRSFVEE